MSLKSYLTLFFKDLFRKHYIMLVLIIQRSTLKLLSKVFNYFEAYFKYKYVLKQNTFINIKYFFNACLKHKCLKIHYIVNFISIIKYVLKFCYIMFGCLKVNNKKNNLLYEIYFLNKNTLIFLNIGFVNVIKSFKS